MDSNIPEKLPEEEGIYVETINVTSNLTKEVVYTDNEAKCVRRKLDFWIMPVLMLSYGLQ
jgi:hypothetical protein